MRDLALGPAGRSVELPGGRVVRRTQRELCLESATDSARNDYEYRLPVPGAIEVPELGVSN